MQQKICSLAVVVGILVFAFGASLVQCAMPPASSSFRFQEIDDKSLKLWEDDRPVLVYNFGTITCDSVPANDGRRSRGCFVHPLYGLHGEVLTEAFPADHYHHVGLFWAWPLVHIDGQEYDLWMSSNIQQKFVRWLGREITPLTAVLGVENGWFVGDKKVMTERIWLTVHRAGSDHRAIDVRIMLVPDDRPVTLEGAPGKSYGGLSIRFAPTAAEMQARALAPPRKPPKSNAKTSKKPKTKKEKEPKEPQKIVVIEGAFIVPPGPDNTSITVPAGVTAEDLLEAPLPWMDLTRQFLDAPNPSGVALFVDPRHPDYPPTALTRHYGVLCVGWPGVKPKTLEPHQPTTLDYRVWVHKGALDQNTLKQAYEAYTMGTQAK